MNAQATASPSGRAARGTHDDYYVYLHAKPDGTFFYVGKGRGRRCREFTANRSRYYLNTVRKIGAENVIVSVFPCGTEDYAFEMEILTIEVLRKAGFNLVNLTDGGDGVRGYVASDETRMKLSMAHKGRSLPIEQRQKMSAARTGRRHSVETREKMSSAAKGRPKSDATREKMSQSQTGKTWSEIRRAKFERKKNAN